MFQIGVQDLREGDKTVMLLGRRRMQGKREDFSKKDHPKKDHPKKDHPKKDHSQKAENYNYDHHDDYHHHTCEKNDDHHHDYKYDHHQYHQYHVCRLQGQIGVQFRQKCAGSPKSPLQIPKSTPQLQWQMHCEERRVRRMWWQRPRIGQKQMWPSCVDG